MARSYITSRYVWRYAFVGEPSCLLQFNGYQILQRLTAARGTLQAVKIKHARTEDYGDMPPPTEEETTSRELQQAARPSSPRRPSIYERDLYNGVSAARSSLSSSNPIPIPSPNVFDGRGIVGVVGVDVVREAVKEGVSSILGSRLGWSASSGKSSAGAPTSAPSSPRPQLQRSSESRGGSVLSRFW